MEVFLIVLVTIAGAGAAFFLFVIEPRRKIYDYDPPRPSVKSVTDGVSEPSRPSSVYLIHPVIVRADEFGSKLGVQQSGGKISGRVAGAN